MTDIDIHAKTDRELLIMVIEKINATCDKVERHDQTLYNSGWGITAQVKVMWACFIAIGAALIKVFLN